VDDGTKRLMSYIEHRLTSETANKCRMLWLKGRASIVRDGIANIIANLRCQMAIEMTAYDAWRIMFGIGCYQTGPALETV